MKQNIKTAAIAVFKEYPTTKSVWVTPDEQAFLHEQRAKMHSSDAVEVLRSDVMDEPADDTSEESSDAKSSPAAKSSAPAKEYPENTTKTAAKVLLAKSLDELEQYRSDDRKTVIAAVAKRETQLLAPKEDVQETDTGDAEGGSTEPAATTEENQTQE